MPVVIAGRQAERYFQGLVDEFAIFMRALSVAAVRAVYLLSNGSEARIFSLLVVQEWGAGHWIRV